MARANIPEEERQDFTMYVDEFQNFATDSFETILSEARKYRLSLVLGNQFMTQLKEELREAIIGNVGTTITGRIGITDAEIMVKRYTPVFDAEDLTKLPNYESVVVAQIEGVPSAPFSMSLIPAMGQSNQQLSDALKRLSAAKYGRSRGQVEQEIFQRLSVKKTASSPGPGGARGGPRVGSGSPTSGSSFLDEWLAKRKQMTAGSGQASTLPAGGPMSASPSPVRAKSEVASASVPAQSPSGPPVAPSINKAVSQPPVDAKSQPQSIQEQIESELQSDLPPDDKLALRGGDTTEVSVKLH